jgi:hypothetical protein
MVSKTPGGRSIQPDGVGVGNAYIMKIIKDGNTYIPTDVHKYGNVVRGEPASAKDAAPKM